MAGACAEIKLPISRVDLGHVGIFSALAEAANLPKETENKVLSLLQAKDVPALMEVCVDVPSPYREALLLLPQLYGGVEVPSSCCCRIASLASHHGRA
jgi:ATP phosphoribosyltransferase regulatory subunit